MAPHAITLVSFGFGESSSKMLLELISDDDDWFIIDVAKLLKKDPFSVVGRGENGEYPQTQKMVFAQDAFPTTTINLFNILIGAIPGKDYSNMAIGCNRGIHRSDTMSRELEELLNSIVDEHGERLFNVMHFPLSQCYNKTDVGTTLDNAMRWSSSPWQMKAGGPKPVRERYAYDACSTMPKASEHWHFIWASVFTVYPDSEYDGEPKPKVARVDDVVDEEVAEAIVTELPEYVSIQSDIKLWYTFLNDQGCDEDSVMELYALAQLNRHGYERANACIGKFLKKKADGDKINNASGFLHAMVLAARHDFDTLNYKKHQAHVERAKDSWESSSSSSGSWDNAWRKSDWSGGWWGGDDSWYWKY